MQNHVPILIVCVAQFYNVYAGRHGFIGLGVPVWRFFATALASHGCWGVWLRLELRLGFTCITIYLKDLARLSERGLSNKLKKVRSPVTKITSTGIPGCTFKSPSMARPSLVATTWAR